MNHNIELSLNRAVAKLPHPNSQQIVDTPVMKMLEHDEITRQFPNKKTSSPPTLMRFAVSFAIFSLIIGLGWFYQFGAVASKISLAVNPSFELEINRAQKLLGIKALNDDAEEILEGCNFNGWDVDKAVSSLVVLLADTQYLTEQNNVVYLSVDGSNSKNLKGRLDAQIKSVLLSKGIPAVVVSDKSDLTIGTQTPNAHDNSAKPSPVPVSPTDNDDNEDDIEDIELDDDVVDADEIEVDADDTPDTDD